ncbi:MAG TPA: ABC transporter substrate-binding protein [Chloroflexota bacterium]|nr:ABC transporter substrate-binding protein [Chloroflexota bacterium]
MYGPTALLSGILAALVAGSACLAPSTAPPPPAGSQSAPSTAAAAPQPPAGIPPAPVKVRWGGQSVLTDSAVYIAEDQGYFREAGIDFEYVNFSSASEIVPSVANNQLDIGAVSPNVATLNALARGAELKLVADRGVLRPGFGWSALVVRTDLIESGRYRTPADLRGLRVAITPPVGVTSIAVAVARLLEREGLTEDAVEFIALPFPDMNPALANRSIDAAVHSEPLMAIALRQGLAVKVLGFDEVYPNQQIGVVAYGESFVHSQPEAARRFMVAYLRGLRDFVDAFTKGRNREAVVESLARHTAVKDLTMYEAMVPTGFNPDGYINVESIAADQEWFISQGKLAQRVDLARVIDHQYVDYALALLGRYQP